MYITSAADLGALIRDRRTQGGLTQAQLAHRAGVSARWLFGVEKGKDTAEIGKVLLVLRQLGVRLSADDVESIDDGESLASGVPTPVDLDAFLAGFDR